MKQLIAPFIRLFSLLCFLWKFKVVLWYLVVDVDDIVKNCDKFSLAYSTGLDGRECAKSALLALLSLRTCNKFVLTTTTLNDDKALSKIIGLIDNKHLFPIAWRIMLGDWSFNVRQDRWSSFTDKIKNVLPFVDRTKAVKQLASVKSGGAELTEQEESDVVELVKLLYLGCTIAPKFKGLKF